MEIVPVTDRRFAGYGQLFSGCDLREFLTVLRAAPLPGEGTAYAASDARLERLPAARTLQARGFGGLPVQIGCCSGRCGGLTCLEYHRTSEIDIAGDDLILLLARQTELEDYTLDTGRVRAFLVPAGTAVELYATTLHYAPCGAAPGRSFRMGCVLPRGTNLEKPEGVPAEGEGRLLWGANKWLIAREGTPEAALGAFVGLRGPAVTPYS